MVQHTSLNKHLLESGWKDALKKNPCSDKKILPVLSKYEKLRDDDFVALIAVLKQIADLSGGLRRDASVASQPALGAYLGNMNKEAIREKLRVSDLKVQADRAEAEEKTEAEDQAEFEKAYREVAKQLNAGLSQVQSGGEHQFLLCSGGTRPGAIMVAKSITSQHKALLTQCNGGSNFTGPFPCLLEDGKVTFVNQGGPLAADRLQASLNYLTGKSYSIRVRGPQKDDKDTEDDEKPAKRDEPEVRPDAKAPFSITGSVGAGGKNKPADVEAVQAALNVRASAGLKVDGKCGTKTVDAIRAFQKKIGLGNPDGRVDPGGKTERALA